MKNVNEIKAEVFRRSDERIKRRKQLQKNIIAVSIPSILCVILAVALLIQNISKKQYIGKLGGATHDMTVQLPNETNDAFDKNGEFIDAGVDQQEPAPDNTMNPYDEQVGPPASNMGDPNTSKVPNTPNVSNDPVVSDAPGYVPNTPNIPDTPDEPNNPGVSNDPVNSADPDIPYSPDEPNAPGANDPDDPDWPNMGSTNPGEDRTEEPVGDPPEGEEKVYVITFVDENGEETVYTLIGNVLISEDGTRRTLTDEELIKLKEYFGLD